MPLFLYTMDDSDTASPQWTISVPTVPGYVRKLGADLAADAAGQDAKDGNKTVSSEAVRVRAPRAGPHA